MANNDIQRHYLVAFEIGSSKIRAAVGAVNHSGIVEVMAVEEERLTDKVRYGCIQNMEVSSVLSTVVERLENYPCIEPRRIEGAYVAVGARSLISRTVDVEMVFDTETEITRPIINELMQKAAATESANLDVVETVPVRYSIDGKTQTSPIGSFGHKLNARVTVISCTPDVKRNLHRAITERLGLQIKGYITRPLAEANLVLTDDERRLGCMFLDFGAETTTVSIYRQGVPIYVATLPMGSRNITKDLIALNYIEERAEEIKKANGNALPGDPTSRHKAGIDGMDYSEINNYVHARADEIVANIVAQLDYAGVKDTDLPGGIIVVGGGARLRGFNELLSRQSKMTVRMGAPTAAVRIASGAIIPAENLDVIATLVEASKLPDDECLSPAPKLEEATSKPDNYDNLQYDPDEEPRIGKLYDDVDDDSDDNDTEPDNFGDDKPKKPESTVSSRTSFMEKIRDRIASMMGDDPAFDGE